ncbi:MAG: site-2 protease family protein [Armatimonadota bacterium]|nr:site-2 protease family protein [Armatimonadota bacterium]MDR7401075.1 site-2 protease family protein [Armatimonadota bacterium]MDR7403573.1 site-2 protease family protein [Armatimonadota bacterium]MDR7436370.1 site-2 protease family protein [Armatimonadota bacterium]MDR7471726.1 site-2 protease family protein [Armatimonadota bacterium]
MRRSSLRRSLAAAGVIGATVALHELAHAWAALRLGGRVREVGVGFGPPLLRGALRGIPVVLRVLPVGGYAAVDTETLPVRRRIPVLLAGPLANVAAGLALLLGLRGHPAPARTGSRPLEISGVVGALAALAGAARHGAGAVGRVAGAVNLGLGLMNLLPVYPLDGGHVVVGLMEARGLPARVRQAFVRLSLLVFVLLAEAALLADLRRLAESDARP